MRIEVCLLALLLVHYSQQAALASDIVATTAGEISTVTWKAGTAGAEDKHASIVFVNGVSKAQNVLATSGGSATSPLFMVAAKATGANAFGLIMIDHANNEIDGGYVNKAFSTSAAQPTGLEDAAVTDSAAIITDLNLGTGITLGAAWTTAASQSVAAVTAATTINIRLYNRLTGTSFTATEAAAQTPATTTTVLSSTTLGADSMITYTCASTAADTGKVATFTDGAATAKTFTLTCKNAGTPAVEVNWNTLSADNDVFTAPPSETASTAISLSTTLGQTVAIGVFSPQDGGTAAAQGTVSGADWINKWMEKSERIIGLKKLHEFVIGGATHVTTGNVNNGDQSSMYFFQSQTKSPSAATSITAILGLGYRYLEIELRETAANTFKASVGSFVTGATGGEDTLSTVTGALATYRGTNANEMYIINISAVTAASGVTLSHSNAQTHIEADSEFDNSGSPRFILRADKDSTYTTLKATAKRYYVSYPDATTASASTKLQDPISKTTSTATDPATLISGVSDALSSAPSAVSVAEFSMGCNRKDTCRCYMGDAIATSAVTKVSYANVIAVDFALDINVGMQAPVYSWIRATTTTSSGAIRTFASVIAATVLSAILLF